MIRQGMTLEARLRVCSEDALGRFAERVWENIFHASGVRYIPLTKLDYQGAPRIEGNGERTVLPDFDCAGDEWYGYLDSKCKSGPVLWRRTREWRHGIDRKNYNAYLRTGQLFNKPAGLGIIEIWNDESTQSKWSGALLVERFSELSTPIDGESNQRHMVYWPRKRFRDLDSYSPEELEATYNGKPPRTYQLELRDVFAPQKQKGLFG